MSRSFLPARLAATWVLFDAMCVQEVVGVIAALRLPRSHGAIPSVIAWRARAVPVIDLAAFVPLLGSSEERSRMLIVHAAGSVIAIPVDAAAEVVHLEDEAVRAAHATPIELAVEEADVEGQLMAILDLNALLQRLLGTGAEDQFADAGV